MDNVASLNKRYLRYDDIILWFSLHYFYYSTRKMHYLTFVNLEQNNQVSINDLVHLYYTQNISIVTHCLKTKVFLLLISFLQRKSRFLLYR